MRVMKVGGGAIASLIGGLLLPLSLALAGNPNERDVKPLPNVQDQDNLLTPDGKLNTAAKIWALEFRFKDPRIITVDIPGRGRTVCWYLWYQVINPYPEPHTFIPDFELVTLDRQTTHHDQVLPKAQEAIKQVEDPTGYLNIKNSVTVYAEPIPAAKPNAIPRPVTGVAIWPDVDPDANRFSIFVSGLSNGYSITDPVPPETDPVVRKKTLQLNFKRIGDRYYMDSKAIRFVGPAEWIYRSSKVNLPATTLAPKLTTSPAPTSPGK
jgi:hypothetical protein